MKWTKEQQEKFFAENPEFMSEYPISRDMIHLLRDPMYRGLMRKIKKYETGEREKYWLQPSFCVIAMGFFEVQVRQTIEILSWWIQGPVGWSDQPFRSLRGFQSQAGYMQVWEGRVPSKSTATWNANNRFSVLVLPGWILLCWKFNLIGSVNDL